MSRELEEILRRGADVEVYRLPRDYVDIMKAGLDYADLIWTRK
jgi:hypothetical protein